MFVWGARCGCSGQEVYVCWLACVFGCGCPAAYSYLMARPCFLPWMAFAHLPNSSRAWAYFWGLCSVPLINTSLHLPTSQSLYQLRNKCCIRGNFILGFPNFCSPSSFFAHLYAFFKDKCLLFFLKHQMKFGNLLFFSFNCLSWIFTSLKKTHRFIVLHYMDILGFI